jgi:hypothetical protein
MWRVAGSRTLHANSEGRSSATKCPLSGRVVEISKVDEYGFIETMNTACISIARAYWATPSTT